jgi:hypothetical protein
MTCDLIEHCEVTKEMSMMKMILASDGVIVEERQIGRLKKEIEHLNDELEYREKKLKKLKEVTSKK